MSWVRSITTKDTANPKTSLGFYAVMTGIVLAGCAGLALSLRGSDQADWLVPVVAIAALLLVSGILLTVIVLNIRSPEKLMLGQITGHEYADITRQGYEVGDSRSGTRVREISPTTGEVLDAEIVDTPGAEEEEEE